MGPVGLGWGILAFAEYDAATRQVVGRKFDFDPIAGNDADVILSHLAGEVGQDDVSILNLHPEHGVGEGFSDNAFHFDRFFFVCHRRKSLGTTATLVNSAPPVDFLGNNAQIS